MTDQPKADASSPVESRDEQLLRATISKLCEFVWSGRATGHMWSIPVDQDRDFDCILTDAVDELVAIRVERQQDQHAKARLEAQARDISIWLSEAGIGPCTIPEGVRALLQQRDALQEENARLKAERATLLFACQDALGTIVHHPDWKGEQDRWPVRQTIKRLTAVIQGRPVVQQGTKDQA